MRKKILPALFPLLVLLFLYAPILVLSFYSFTDSSQIGAIRSFSLKNYYVLFTTPEIRRMILGTIILALSSSLLASILGTLGAIGSFYSGRRISTAFDTVNQIPVINADVVTAFSMCILLVVVLGVDKDTYLPLFFGHVTLSAPFVYLSVLPRLKQADSSLYEAALDLGARPHQALMKVVIPQIIPGIFSGFSLAITLSLDDYFIATYTKPATFETISTYVVNATKGSQTSIKTALWALSAIIFLIVVLFVALSNLQLSKETNNEEKI